MTASGWVIAAIALLSLVATVIIGVRSARASERAAEAAEESAASAQGALRIATQQLETSATAQDESLRLAQEQLENSVRAHNDSVQPYVWADLRPRDDGGILVLLLGNSGPTVATDIHVEFDPPLEQIVPEDVAELAQKVQAQLTAGVKSLPSGRTFIWFMGPARAFFRSDISAPAAELSLTITASGPHGPIAPSSYAISLEDLRMQMDRATGLALLEKPLNGVGKQLETVSKHLDRISKLLSRPKDE